MIRDIKDSLYHSLVYENRYEFILEGLKNTILISFLAVILGVALGIILALSIHYHKEKGKLKFLSHISKIYIAIIRGTPVLLQLMILYYIIFRTVNIDIVLVGMIAFGMNSAAYVAEIIRAGIDSIEKGQIEAAYSLGLRNILPALGNEFITLVKETSVAGYIGIIELTKASDIIASTTYDYFFPLIIVAFLYLIMTLGLSKILKRVERILNKNVRN